MSDFTEVPVLDYALSTSEETKPACLEKLKHALLEVGFLYVKNTGVDTVLVDNVVRLGKAFFDLPEEEKLRLEMKNSPHFVGYSRLGNEITKSATDWREQFDLGTELPVPADDEPRYRWLRGPNQWPPESSLPEFKKTCTEYMDAMGSFSEQFLSLVAEALGLERDLFAKYYEGSESASGTKRQDRLKIVRYPDATELKVEESDKALGVGPHKDSDLSSYLLQASDHKGLQIQNYSGTWIDCPPIPGTFVVAMGKGMEAITGGVCVATTHRVIAPAAGEGSRFSIPFFQGVSYDTRYESIEIPEEVKKLKREVVKGDAETSPKPGDFRLLGEATLVNRVKSHPDVGAKFYPEVLAKIRSQEAASAAIGEALPSEKAATKHAESLLLIPGPANTTANSTEDGGSISAPRMRARAPTIVLEKIESDIPSYGEDPGPDGSIERKEAWKMRQADATPDEVIVITPVDEHSGSSGYMNIKGTRGGLGAGLAP